MFLAKNASKCFDKFCPSLLKVEKKGKTVIERRTCTKCGKYHSTIKAMTAHKRLCEGSFDEGEDESMDEDDKEDEEEADFVEFVENEDED